jgi:ectoine hydroxylase-related dioxygenase (phytanoyl-CoA dioxygenase family)
MSRPPISQDLIDTFQKDGVVLIKGLFKDYVDAIRMGVERNMAEPGPYAAENLEEGAGGRFFDDYCNWTRIPEFEDVIRNSSAAAVAAELMNSNSVRIFHDHVLVKEPGTSKPTPWHQDSPYYFVDGNQTVSFWCPVDPVIGTGLRCVAGSHRWSKPVLPTRWLSDENFYEHADNFKAAPNPDDEGMDIKEWDMEPGDAVAFDFRTLHGARGNTTQARRRAFSLRLVGDDARFVERPGPTSPPFPGHEMETGQVLREDWFPIIFQR